MWVIQCFITEISVCELWGVATHILLGEFLNGVLVPCYLLSKSCELWNMSWPEDKKTRLVIVGKSRPRPTTTSFLTALPWLQYRHTCGLFLLHSWPFQFLSLFILTPFFKCNYFPCVLSLRLFKNTSILEEIHLVTLL